jgi:hypothetical protein
MTAFRINSESGLLLIDFFYLCIVILNCAVLTIN